MEQTDGLILLDVSANQDVTYAKDFLEKLGHPVMVCHGPPHRTLCPLLSDTGCTKAESAHGIVFELDLDRPQHRAILKRYREVLREDIPIRVVVQPGQEQRFADLLDEVEVWLSEPTVGELDGFAA